MGDPRPLIDEGKEREEKNTYEKKCGALNFKAFYLVSTTSNYLLTIEEGYADVCMLAGMC